MDTLHLLTQPLFFQRKENILVHCCLKFFLRIGLSYQNNTSDYNLEKDLEIIWSQLDSQITDITNYICYLNSLWMTFDLSWCRIEFKVEYLYKSFIMVRQFMPHIDRDITLRVCISINTFKLALLFNISSSCIQTPRCNLVKPNGEK